MSSNVAILLTVLVAAVGFGLWRRATDGRVREAKGLAGPSVPLGDRATLVQFSSAVCAPCAASRRILTEVAQTPGVEHVELDVEAHLGLVEQFDIKRTPTVLLLGAAGDVRKRVVGVPRVDELHSAIADLTEESL